MARVINDSDDDEDLEDLFDGVNDARIAGNGYPQDKTVDERTQSTGSTGQQRLDCLLPCSIHADTYLDRMLKHAHVQMIQSTTPDQRSSPSVTTPSKSAEHEPPSSKKLKRARTSEAAHQDDSNRKKRKTEHRRDDWDIPLSSSPVKEPSSKSVKSSRPQKLAHEPMVIITDHRSIIMDATSSDDRRMRELQSLRTAADDSAVTLERSSERAEDRLLEDCVVLAPTLRKTDTSDAVGQDDSLCEPTSYKEKKKRKSGAQEGHEAEQDELSIDIAQEHYQPRASRSRLHQTSTQILQPSEGAASSPNARVKKRRTAGVARVENRQALQAMGFGSSQADRALKETDNNLQRATEWILNNVDAEQKENAQEIRPDESPGKLGDSRRRGRSQKAAVILDDNEDRVDRSPTRDIQGLEEKHDNAYVKESVAEEPLAQTEMGGDLQTRGIPLNNFPIDEAPKKRGRGRPRKQDNAKRSTEQLPAPDEKLVQQDTAAVEEPEPPREAEEIGDIAPKDASQRQPTEPTVPEPSATSEEGESVAVVKATVTSKTSTRISPITSGNVPLRVGLSKRTKIPSLLRIARK